MIRLRATRSAPVPPPCAARADSPTQGVAAVNSQLERAAGEPDLPPDEPGLPTHGPAGLVRQGMAYARAVMRGADGRARAQRTAATAFAVRVASAGLAFASQVVLARWMGSFEYGLFVYVWVWVNVVGMVSTLGLGTVVLRFIPEYRQRGDHARLRGLIFGSRVFVFAVSTLAAAVGALGVYLFEDAIASYYVLPIYLAFFCFPFYSLTDIQDGVSRAHNWIVLALAPNYIVRPLLILAVMGGAILADFPPTVTTAVFAVIAATWLSALGQFLVVNRRLARTVPKSGRRYEPKLWLTTALPLILVDGFDMLLGHMDVLMLSYFRTPEDVGIYFAALKTMSLVAFVAFAVKAGLSHRFSEFHAAGDHEGLSRFVRDTVNWTFWPSLVAAAGILAVGYPLLWLFGPEFTSGYPLMFFLVIGFLAKAAVGPVEQVLNMLGHQVATLKVLSMTLALNILINLLLIPPYGARGAAIATSAALVLESVMLFHQAKKRLGLRVVVWHGRGS